MLWDVNFSAYSTIINNFLLFSCVHVVKSTQQRLITRVILIAFRCDR